jgi:hypothetical protein
MIAVTEAGRAKQAEAFAHWTTAQSRFNEAVGVERLGKLQALMEACFVSLRHAASAM